MIGEKDKIGFIYDDPEVSRFYPDKQQKYMWHLWGSKDLPGNGNFIRDLLVEKRVKEHLITNGYKEEEILSIEAEYNMKFNTNRIKGTFAYVVFKDEPGEKYLYLQWRESGKVQQECSYYSEDTGAYEVKYTEKRKHMIKNCY